MRVQHKIFKSPQKERKKENINEIGLKTLNSENTIWQSLQETQKALYWYRFLVTFFFLFKQHYQSKVKYEQSVSRPAKVKILIDNIYMGRERWVFIFFQELSTILIKNCFLQSIYIYIFCEQLHSEVANNCNTNKINSFVVVWQSVKGAGTWNSMVLCKE